MVAGMFTKKTCRSKLRHPNIQSMGLLLPPLFLLADIFLAKMGAAWYYSLSIDRLKDGSGVIPFTSALILALLGGLVLKNGSLCVLARSSLLLGSVPPLSFHCGEKSKEPPHYTHSLAVGFCHDQLLSSRVYPNRVDFLGGSLKRGVLYLLW